MSLSFLTLDVFTETSFEGNPVAIVKVPAGTNLAQSQKQRIAREFNLSETVFLHEQTEDDIKAGDVRINIFTPIDELPFAGHPTIGTSNYLLRYSGKKNGDLALQTKAGRIPIRLTPNKDGVQIDVAHNVHIHNQPFKNEAYGHYPVVSIVKGMTFILAKLESLEELAKPTSNLVGTENTYKKKTLLDEGWHAGIVNSYFYVDLGYEEDGVRRVRTRGLGSREDPGTGSAASALCSYLSLQDKSAAKSFKYHLTQGVELGRRCDIYVEVTRTDDGQGIEKVVLSGTAVKAMEGQVNIPNPA